MKEQLTQDDYKSNVKPSWCPGCGHYSVYTAMTRAFSHLNIPLENLVVVSGIGCSSRIPYFMKSYGFHGVHGRALPLAVGIKSVNPKIRVVVAGGDGDGFSIGGNHMLHTARKNPDMTYIVMDNAIYGLTKGQVSPTSPIELHTKVNPYENIDEKLNPVLIALGNDTSFIARSFSGDLSHLTDMIIQGMEHRGFSFIHVMSPCIQFNKEVTFDSLRKNMQRIPEDHDVTDRAGAVKLALAKSPLYTGIFYNYDKKTLKDKLGEVRQIAKHKDDPEYNEKERKILKKIMEQFN